MKNGDWIIATLIDGAGGPHAGRVVDLDDRAISIKLADLQAGQLSDWIVVVPWATLLFAMVAPAGSFDQFRAALQNYHAAQSAKAN